MSEIKYFDLSIPAAKRLAMMRADFAAHGTRYPHCPESSIPKSWRDVRHYGFHNWESAHGTLDQGSNDKTPVWYCDTGPQFRDERFCDEIEDSPIDHRGWFTDDDCGETIRGIVARLTHGRYIAGYWMSCNGERVYFSEVFDDPRKAARFADRRAESLADDEREYQTRWREAKELTEKIERKEKRLRECLVMRHRECMAYVRQEIPRIIASIRKARETLATDYAGVEF